MSNDGHTESSIEASNDQTVTEVKQQQSQELEAGTAAQEQTKSDNHHDGHHDDNNVEAIAQDHAAGSEINEDQPNLEGAAAASTSTEQDEAAARKPDAIVAPSTEQDEVTDSHVPSNDAALPSQQQSQVESSSPPNAGGDDGAASASKSTAEAMDASNDDTIKTASENMLSSTSDAGTAASASVSGTVEDSNSRASTPAPGQTAMSETATATTGSSNNGNGSMTKAGSSSMSSTIAAKLAAPKKFTSSLSMNKKFLEKSGAAATDSKSPQLANASLPKSISSPAARSPALASPGIPSHPGTSASPPIVAGSSAPLSSHPRLLTGKLSSLGNPSGSGTTPPPSSSATWGRPGLKALGSAAAAGGATSTAFGKSGFVPAPTISTSGPMRAPQLGGSYQLPPGQPMPGQAGRAPKFAAFGAGGPRGAPGSQGQGGPPWAGRGNDGFGRPSAMERDFPSFQEAAKAEEHRQHAILAKEKAEKMAAAAAAAYNQRLLEGLKGFSGEHTTSSGAHWDTDESDDDMEDILEFADGMRYEVPHSAALPTEAEAAAFQQAAAASEEAAALHAAYEKRLAEEGGGGQTTTSGATEEENIQSTNEPTNKSERFVDDYNRRTNASTVATGTGQTAIQSAPSQTPAVPALSSTTTTGGAPPPAIQGRGPQQPGRTLYNDRLGRFEPYAGRPQLGKKDRKVSDPAVLQRPQRPNEGQAQQQQQQRQPLQRGPSATQQQPGKNPLSPTNAARKQANEAVKSPEQAARPTPQSQQQSQQQQPKKVDSPWAKLPPVQKQPIQTQPSPPSQSQPPASNTATAPVVPATATTAQQAPAQPSTPAQPTEDPEVAYKREMQSIAERARKRRAEEEMEREAQRARALAKAKEIEDKMNAEKKEAAQPSKPVQPTILSPPASARQDRQANWRRISTSEAIKPQSLPQSIQQRIVSQPKEQVQFAPSTERPQDPPSKVHTAPSQKQVQPSQAAFAALADFTSSSWRKPDARGEQPVGAAEAKQEPVVEKHDALLVEQPSTSQQASSSHALPLASDLASIANTGFDNPLSPTSSAPRVRLGRRMSPVEASIVPKFSANGTAIPHAFPQPTILVGRSGLQTAEAPFEGQTTSALDKIMQQVKAAQNDLKSKQAAMALLEEERKRYIASRREDFDGTLSRISQALGEAAKTTTVKGKGREYPPPSMRVFYTPEVFDVTAPERPASPRSWKVFSVKFPTLARKAGPTLHYRLLKAFDDLYTPPPVFSSSWMQGKNQKLPKGTTTESYLFPKPEQGELPRVKVSKLYQPSADPTPPEEDIVVEQDPRLSRSGSVSVDTLTHDRQRALHSSKPIDVYVTKESLTVADPPLETLLLQPDYEEDSMTIPFESIEDSPQVVKVSLPRKALQEAIAVGSQTVKPTLGIDATSPDMGRFRSYGPRLPENTTVAFRRGMSPSKGTEGQEPTKCMFLMTSELNGTREAEQAYTRSHDQQVVDEVSQLSRAFHPDPFPRDTRPSPTLGQEQVFPSLSRNAPGSDRPRQDSPGAQSSSMSGMRKEELPRHVIDELERLNATVSAAPLTVPPRLDSPGTLLPGRASPWAATGANRHAGMPSSLSLSAIDPSMSVWSKPTEQATSAAAAAFASSSNENANDSLQDNTLKDLPDDYPGSMPTDAMELPISDSEIPRSRGRDSEASTSAHGRSLSTEDRMMHYPRQMASFGQAMSPGTRAIPLPGRQRHVTAGTGSSSSRHGSFTFSPHYAGQQSSPYAVHAQLPYATAGQNIQMHGQQVYSPAAASYGGAFVPASSAYGTAYSQSANLAQGASNVAVMGHSYPVTMTGSDGRPISATSGNMWMPENMMNGAFNSGAAISPYSPAPTHSGYMGASGAHQKSRVHSSPLYHHQHPQHQHQQQYSGSHLGGQHRASPSSAEQQQGYATYGYYPTATSPVVSSRAGFNAFSPRLTSPGVHHGGSYSASQQQQQQHLRSASAQQYGRRPGAPSW